MPWPKIYYPDPEAPRQLVASIRETGFAVLSEVPIPAVLIAQVYREWETFFQSPRKYMYLFDPAIQSGYFPFRSETAKGQSQPDLKEFFHLYEWTALPHGMSDHTWQLFHQLRGMAEIILGWLEQGLPEAERLRLSTPLSAMIRASSQTLLRPIHYPPLPANLPNGSVRAAAHEDINLVTLLPAATAVGLEVQTHHGKWVAIPSQAGDVIVNVGDMLDLATAGFYRSTSHRVVNPAEEEGGQTLGVKRSRFSLPLFLHPRPEVVLAPNVTAADYLNARLKDLGLLS